MITVKIKSPQIATINGTPIYAYDTEYLSRNYFDIFYDGRYARKLSIEEVKKVIKSFGESFKIVQDVNCLSELYIVRKPY